MKGNKSAERKRDAKELEQSIHMVKAPLRLTEDPSLTLPKVRVKVPGHSEENRMEE